MLDVANAQLAVKEKRFDAKSSRYYTISMME